jgi:hypothetical protein
VAYFHLFVQCCVLWPEHDSFYVVQNLIKASVYFGIFSLTSQLLVTHVLSLNFQTCQQMMWALEYDPDIFFAACEEASTTHKKVSKSKLKGLRHFGKWDKESTKNGAEDGEEGLVPISVFMVASVLKEKRENYYKKQEDWMILLG